MGPVGPPLPTDSELVAIAERAARVAGAELMSRWGGEALRVRSKSTPTDPVSEADLAAESAVRELLTSLRPDDAVLGEEGGATRGDGGFRWVVDPLDGTVNYLYGIPQFAVSVACEDADGAVAGVVLDPVRDECFSAVRSGPALLNGEPVRVERPSALAEALVGTGFGYDAAVRAAQAEVLLGVLPRARDIRRAGAAALDLCWCACGRLDAYYERGLKRWDVAAGGLMCSRAGLVVRSLPAAGPLPDGVVVAPPGLIDELFALVIGPGAGPPVD
jgi:myo-inositol-1(or 4)-monophosphatase